MTVFDHLGASQSEIKREVVQACERAVVSQDSKMSSGAFLSNSVVAANRIFVRFPRGSLPCVHVRGCSIA